MRREPVSAAVRATYLVFIANGFAIASWASRIPTVREHLHLSAGQLGLVLLSIAAGSVVSLPATGAVIGRFGTRRTVTGMALLEACALIVAGVGYSVGTPLVVAALFLLGFGTGGWDVAMNVQGATVERHLGRAILPRFHAGFSFGTVAGALVGAGMEALHVAVLAHFAVVAVLAASVVVVAVGAFLPDETEIAGESDRTEADAAEPAVAVGERGRAGDRIGRALVRWRETRTVLIGLFVLTFAFAEGTGNDWISVAFIDGYHLPTAIGTLGFAVFLAAMTGGRWLGPQLLGRYGRVAVVRTLAAVAVLGLCLFVFGRLTPLAYAGALLWGAGTSLGFPVGMSAAADEPGAAAARVSVVASIGYCAFLGGPPLIGFLASHVGVLHAFLAVAALLALAVGLAGALRPPAVIQAERDTRRAAQLPG